MRKLIVAIILPVVSLVSFCSGVKYNQLDRHRDELVMFANLSGDHILEMNRMFERGLSAEVQKQKLILFNSNVLSDFGCAPWLSALSESRESNLERFREGLAVANSSARGSEFVDEECVENLKEHGYLN